MQLDAYKLNPTLQLIEEREGIYFFRTSSSGVFAFNETSYKLISQIEHKSIVDIATDVYAGLPINSNINLQKVTDDFMSILHDLIKIGLIITNDINEIGSETNEII